MRSCGHAGAGHRAGSCRGCELQRRHRSGAGVEVPHDVRTLTVLEPPPVGVPSAAEFRAASARLSDTFEAHGPMVALDEFLTQLVGPDWRHDAEESLPGSVAAMERDAVTFFSSDLPALLSWTFEEQDAASIRCPVLYVGGSTSGPWFAEMRALLQRLLPQTDGSTVAGAGHLLAATHPGETAGIVVPFLRRHAITPPPRLDETASPPRSI